ncbi:hypothetical protein SO802_019011, partial [Lithocarpus litseifolius]
EEEEEEEEEEEDDDQYNNAQGSHQQHQQKPQPKAKSNSKSLDELDAKLKALKLKYASSSSSFANPNSANSVKPYLHIGDNTPKAKWIISNKHSSYSFVKTSKIDGDGDDNDDESDGEGQSWWILRVGAKVRARVSLEMQLKMFGDQWCVDFVSSGIWALKFPTDEAYRNFVTEFQNCIFENVYRLEATEENKIKVYGKEFIGWVKPELNLWLCWCSVWAESMVVLVLGVGWLS